MTLDTLRSRLQTQVDIFHWDASSPPPAPAGNYSAIRVHRGVAYVSGQMPLLNDGSLYPLQDYTKNHLDLKGIGYQAARLAMANALLQLVYCSSVASVRSIIRIDGFFNHTFSKDLPSMLDGASDLVVEVLDHSQHARTVFGCRLLPHDAWVELMVIAEVG